MNDIITLKGISKSFRVKRYQLFQALNNVTVAVRQGEAFGFIGPNGAGKSTTIKILTGIIAADSGEARIFGIPVDNHNARKGMSYVPENPYLYDYLTPLEMLLMGCRMHGLEESGLRDHCMDFLERFGISHVAKKRIRTFSKGMTQRTALAHALACKPKLLILDEPLSGLDPIGRAEVVDILLEYRNKGGTIFFSSHVLTDVQRLGDRFCIIHKGVVRAINTPADLVSASDNVFVIRTLGATEVGGLSPDGPEKWHVQVEQHNLAEWLQRLKLAGHQIIEVKGGLSLEQAFLRIIRNIEGGDLPRFVQD